MTKKKHAYNNVALFRQMRNELERDGLLEHHGEKNVKDLDARMFGLSFQAVDMLELIMFKSDIETEKKYIIKSAETILNYVEKSKYHAFFESAIHGASDDQIADMLIHTSTNDLEAIYKGMEGQSNIRARRLFEEVENELARRKFSYFVKATVPDYQMGWFHQLLCDALDDFHTDVLDGKRPRLMIFAPPRHGKSQLFSICFPAWCFGRTSDLRMISCSYSFDLASRLNGKLQQLMVSERYRAIFPRTILGGKYGVKNKKSFDVAGGDGETIKGGYLCAGVKGGITGEGANISIIDDVVKDFASIASASEREKVYEWYCSTFLTRALPENGQLLGMTRWHEDDLAGRLLKRQEEMKKNKEKIENEWKVIRFPAIAEKKECFREKGEPLHPERFPLSVLKDIKKDVGSYVWSALYQQRPTPMGGLWVKGSWFGRYDTLPEKWVRKAIFCDLAFTSKESADYTVLQCVGLSEDRNLYIIDQERGQWDASDVSSKIVDFWQKHKSKTRFEPITKLYIEEVTSSLPILQSLIKKNMISTEGIKPIKDKFTRLMSVQGFLKNGVVRLPKTAPWVHDYIHEFEAFRADMKHPHDDQVDTTVMALLTLKSDTEIGKRLRTLQEIGVRI